MANITPNFTTATNSEAFKITSKMLNQKLNIAKSEGRKYACSPLNDDYWIPEKRDFDYEIACPNFIYFQSEESSFTVMTVYGLFETYQGYQNLLLGFARVFQYKGELNLQELLDIARMYSYMRFCLRDNVRDLDQKWWSNFLLSNVVSNETTLIFTEDKLAAKTWANKTFPNNSYNAWIGKCGEFIFATWAGERGLSISRVDLKDHPYGDEYDFSHSTLFKNRDENTLKIDVKTFQLNKENKRDWWYVSKKCLVGEHRQDVIIFVILDEDLRMGKVVGFLMSDSLLKTAEYIDNNFDDSFYSQGYYKVYLKDIYNPYYLRALLDSRSQIFNGLFCGVDINEAFAEIVKDYPLDPMTSYHLILSGENYCNSRYYEPISGGIYNLTAKPTLELLIENPIFNQYSF